MKPLLSQPITRQRQKIGDYESAADQATDAGRDAFAGRQKARMVAAQADQVEVRNKVRKLK